VIARKLIGTMAGLTLAAGAFAAPAHAATCPDAPSTRAFQPWLDFARYTAIPGGDFETAGWELDGGAERVAGGTPWRPGSTVLSLPDGGRATSPPVCISVDRPVVRAFARNVGSPLGLVSVTVIVPTDLGDLRLPIGVVANLSSDWAPTLPAPVLDNLLTLLGGPGDVRFEFAAHGAGAAWLVDDVLLDPYSKG